MSDWLYNAWFIIVVLLALILAAVIAGVRRIPRSETIDTLSDEVREIGKKLDSLGETLVQIEMNTDLEWQEKRRRRASEP